MEHTLMSDAVRPQEAAGPLAREVTFEDYLEHYAGQFCEWVAGEVIQMAPATFRHNMLIRYLGNLLEAYLALRPLGQLVPSPFVMRLDDPPRGREPDLMVVLNSNPHPMSEAVLHGPADICVEVVSLESTARDYGTKLAEYEGAGVGEYWLIDPIRRGAHFYRLNDAGVFVAQGLDEDGNYRPGLLPGLRVPVPTLWRDPLPDLLAVAEMVRAMVGEED
jgi:Uma2 family endonuclease